MYAGGDNGITVNNHLTPFIRQPWFGYIITLAVELLVVLTLVILRPIFPLGERAAPYILLVMLSAYLFGEGPAILSLVLGWLAFKYYFIPPTGHLWPMAHSMEGWTGEAAFLFGGFTVGLAARMMCRSRERVLNLLRDARRDLEERKKTEEALQASKERFRLAIEGLLDAFSMLSPIRDESGRIVDFVVEYANHIALQIGNVSREELIGHRLLEVLPAQSATGLFDMYTRVMETGEPLIVDSLLYEDIILGRPLRIFMDVRASKVGSTVVVAFRDVTTRVQAQEAVEAERRRLQDVLDILPVGVFIADANGRLVKINEQVNKIWHYTEFIDKGISEYKEYKGWWADTGEPLKGEDWAMARAIMKGETSVGEVIDIERFDGTRGTILNSGAPLRDAEGHIIGGVVAIQDITELVQLRRDLERSLRNIECDRKHLAALESIGEAGIAAPLERQDVLNTVAERMAKGLDAHSCTIFIFDEQEGYLNALAAYNIPEERGFRIRSGEAFEGKIAETRRTIYIEDAEHDPLVVNPHVKRKGVKSLLGTPLIARGKLIGVVYLDMMEIRKYKQDEIHYFELMASRAALIIDNARLYEELVCSKNEVENALEREEHFSRMLQRALLPPKPSIGDGYEVADVYVAAYASREIGGDFYDVFPTESGEAAILIGDVSGKGLESASFAAATRSTLRAFAFEFSETKASVAHANRSLYEQRPQVENPPFVTVAIAIIDLPSGHFSYSSAGHPPQAIYRAADSTVEFLGFGDPPIGVLPSWDFGKTTHDLGIGDKLVFYTDGLTEARKNTDMFGEEGIAGVLRENGHLSPNEVVDKLLTAATAWSGGHIPDDTAIVVVERKSEMNK